MGAESASLSKGGWVRSGGPGNSCLPQPRCVPGTQCTPGLGPRRARWACGWQVGWGSSLSAPQVLVCVIVVWGWCSQAFQMCAVLCCALGLDVSPSAGLGGAPSLQLGWYGWHKQGVCREHLGAPCAEWGERYSMRGGASGSLGEAASGVSAVGRLGAVSSHTCVCVYTRVLALTPYPPHPAPVSLQ